MYIYNPNTWETKAGKLGAQGQPQLHRMFEASKGYVKLNKQKVNLYKSSGKIIVSTYNLAGNMTKQ